MACKVKRGDKVIVIAGKDKGKTGVVSKVYKDLSRALVSGINLVCKHVKPSQKLPEGGRVNIERPLHISNIAHLDPKTGLKTRVGFKSLSDGSKVRYAKRSKEIIDNK